MGVEPMSKNHIHTENCISIIARFCWGLASDVSPRLIRSKESVLMSL